MVCLIKEKYKSELKRYKNILGSEEAAYYVLAMNNGFDLKYTFDGEDSDLFNALLEKNGGDEKLAIIDKCLIFSSLFLQEHGDFTLGEYKGVLDKKGEPSILDLNGGPLCDSSALFDVLENDGEITKENQKFLDALDILEKNNFLIRDFVLYDAIDYNRSAWVNDEMNKFLSENPNADNLAKFVHRSDLNKTWNLKQMKKLMTKHVQRIAEYYDLEKVENRDGTWYYRTKEGSKQNPLLVHFVNSLRTDNWVDENGFGHKGLFSTLDGMDAYTNMVFVSLEDGDPTTFIHEIAHHYIQTFWESDVVQKALAAVDAQELNLVRRFKKNPRLLEEKLVNAICDKTLLREKNGWVGKFWTALTKLIKKTLGIDLFNYNKRLNIIDTLSMYVSINQDLSDNKCDNIIYKYIKGNRFSGSIDDLINKVYKDTLRSLNRKRGAIRAKMLKDNYALAQIDVDIDTLKQIDPTTLAFTDYLINLVAKARKDLIKLSTDLVIFSNDKNALYNTSPKQLIDWQTDLLEYYASLFGSSNINILYLVESNISKELSDQIEYIRGLLSNVSASYNVRIREYVYHKIDEAAEEYVDIGDKELWKSNAKLWVNNQVDNGRLMFGETYIGIASLSKSPIIRLIEFMITSQNNFVRSQCLPKGHKLYELYKKCNFGDVSFSNAMKLFYELDENGDPTGYWVRPLNYGKMFRDKDKLVSDLMNEERFKGKITIDEEGNYIFLDDQIKKEFLNAKDIVEDTISNKKYKAQYYIDKRDFLSQATIDAQSLLQRQIDILVLKCTDNVTGIPEFNKLTQPERKQLDSLYKQKSNLSNPYNIVYDGFGNIESFTKKEGAELLIAEELMKWLIHLSEKMKYSINSLKFKKDRDALIEKYKDQGGENSEAVKWFDWYFKSTLLSEEFYKKKSDIRKQLFGDLQLPDDIQILYRKRAAIINAITDKRGYYQPHLERLNDLVWDELLEIDNKIALYNALHKIDKEDVDKVEEISEKVLVKRYVNGTLTDQKYLLYLKDVTPEEKFYKKYYRNVYDENGDIVGIRPLSVFLYEKPIDDSYIEDLPIGPYSELDKTSEYANPDYDSSDSSYIQPKKELYKNDQYDEITGNKRQFFNYLLEIMQEANSYIPNYIDTRSHRTPGMTEKTSHLLFRKSGNFFKNIWHHFWGKTATVSDTNVLYNEELAVKPNGEKVYTIPLRWIRKLDDPRDTCTDAIGAVMKYYEMALNYKVMSEFAPLTELFKTTMQGGTTAGSGIIKDSQQLQRLKSLIKMRVYGKMRQMYTGKEGVLNKLDKTLQVALDGLARNAYLKMMAHNTRGILKNAFDSGMSSIVEVQAGKYFEKSDLAFACGVCGRESILGIRSINTPVNLSKVSAAMQFNGQSGTIGDMFSDFRDSSVRRFLSRNYAMGEYTFVDYTIKGWLAPAIYHNHRLIDNFEYRGVNIGGQKYYINKNQAESRGILNKWENSTDYRKEYMNKLLAIYSYIKVGKTRKDAETAWESLTLTLWDAYDVNENGDFVLKLEYLDKVRPLNIDTNVRSRKIEDRIAGTMRERYAVIAGMLPQENKGEFLSTGIGMFVFLLRGWIVTFLWDCLRAGKDFTTLVDPSDINKDSTSEQYIPSAENVEFYQEMFDFETGQTGKGWLRGQGYLWKKILFNTYNKLLNTFFSMNKGIKVLTSTLRQLVGKLTQYLFMAVLCIIGTHIFGRLIEHDPENLIYNIGYSESLALTPERTTQINPLTVLDLIKNATAAQSYLDDIQYAVTMPYDWGKTAVWGFNWAMGDQEFYEDLSLIVKTGSYTGFPVWIRDALKSSSIIAPGLGLNNIVRNFSVYGNNAYQTWQSGQIPNQWLLDWGVMYKPEKKGKSKKSSSKSKYY